MPGGPQQPNPIQSELDSIFNRDWNSPYAFPLSSNEQLQCGMKPTTREQADAKFGHAVDDSHDEQIAANEV